MTATITANDSSGTSTTPVLVSGYETTRTSRNVIHDLIGGGIAVSLIRPRFRSGSLSLLYSDQAAAWDALAMHARETSFTLVDTDVSAVSMTYVLTDQAEMTLTLDDETRKVWTLSVPYQEIEP